MSLFHKSHPTDQSSDVTQHTGDNVGDNTAQGNNSTHSHNPLQKLNPFHHHHNDNTTALNNTPITNTNNPNTAYNGHNVTSLDPMSLNAHSTGIDVTDTGDRGVDPMGVPDAGYRDPMSIHNKQGTIQVGRDPMSIDNGQGVTQVGRDPMSL